MFEDEWVTGNGRLTTDDLENKRARRLEFMIGLYEAVDGFDAQPVAIAQIADKLDLRVSDAEDRLEILKRVRFLQGEGLIAVSGSPEDIKYVTITHEGVREVEEARSRPDRPTKHFPPISRLDAATEVDQLSLQNGTREAPALLSEQNRLEVLRSVQSLEEWADQLPIGKEPRSELDADLRTIRAQLESPRPKARLIELALQSVKNVVNGVPSGLGTTAGIISSGISRTIDDLVGRLS